MTRLPGPGQHVRQHHSIGTSAMFVWLGASGLITPLRAAAVLAVAALWTLPASWVTPGGRDGGAAQCGVARPLDVDAIRRLGAPPVPAPHTLAVAAREVVNVSPGIAR